MKILDRIFSINKEKGVVHEDHAPFLSVSDLTIHYDGERALHKINFELQAGEQVAVVGPNGAGKSTLFKAIAGVLPVSRGKIHMYGSTPGGHICIAYVPQRSEVDWRFPATVEDVVMMGRVGQLGLFRNPGAKDWDFVHESLSLVNMERFAKRQIDELSGGQQQRMFIAQALSQEANLLMLDEPLNGLDLPSQEEFFHILDELQARDVTVMVSMHDLSKAREFFDKIMLLNKRLISLGVAAEALTEETLKLAYGDHLQMVETPQGVLVLNDTCCDD